MYSRSARSPELGYVATRAIVTGAVDIEKPVLPVEPLSREAPPPDADRGNRRVYYEGKFVDARIHAMERLEPGNVIEGFSIVESPSTTFVVPTGRRARLDEHRIFHLTN
jgi:acetone carboxylase beta subunit